MITGTLSLYTDLCYCGFVITILLINKVLISVDTIKYELQLTQSKNLLQYTQYRFSVQSRSHPCSAIFVILSPKNCLNVPKGQVYNLEKFQTLFSVVLHPSSVPLFC